MNIGLFLTRELKSSHFHKYNLDSLGFLKFKIVYGGKVEVSSDSFPPTRRRKMPCHLMFFERHQDGMQEQWKACIYHKPAKTWNLKKSRIFYFHKAQT